MRHLPLVILGGLLAACSSSELTVHDAHGEDHGEVLVLEGAELRAELTSSPPRRAPVEFRRLALMWDAPSDAALEFSVSVDGSTWGDWQPVELQHREVEGAHQAFVGALDLPAGARHYRVRQPGTELATFALISFMEQVVPQDQGFEPEDADDSLGSQGQGLSYGAAAVNNRASWGARAPRCKSGMSPYRFTIHHTVSPTNDPFSPQARIRQTQSYHMDTRGYCDIGYNFLVSRDGRLWEGRGATVQGGHAGGANGGNIGICVLGTYTVDTATGTQMDSIARLLKGLGSTFGIAVNSNTTKGHRQVGTTPTACPGNALFAQIPTIISKANTTVSSGTSTGPVPTGCGVLKGGSQLSRGQMAHSCSGKYRLAHQTDGNVVLYNLHSGKALWHLGTNGKATTALAMQGDGNFVLYNGGTVLWHSKTFGNPGSSLAVQDDGNLVIYGPGPKALWNTGTSGQ